MSVFITGSTGCIGIATLTYLLDHGVDRVVGYNRSINWERIDARYRERVKLLKGDITDGARLRAAILETRPAQIIHLAAFQTPDCQAHPFEGMQVNVEGTMNLFRAAAELKEKLQRVVFASSAAVYGPRTLYPAPTVDTEAPLRPSNLYGYWKVAGEGVAQAFHRETGIPTVSLRLATTYGPGRDKGLTSAPTTAIKSVVRGVPFHMPYQGRENYHYVADVGAGFAQAATEPFEGCRAFNLRGRTITVNDFLEFLQQIAVCEGIEIKADLGIAPDATTMPFACDLDDRATLDVFPRMPLTDIPEGIRKSLEHFMQMAADSKR